VPQTVSEVESAYWSLIAARRDLNVRRGSLALAEQRGTETQIRIDAGTAPPSGLAQPNAELGRRRNDLFAVQAHSPRAARGLFCLRAARESCRTY
jgi:outer membrane protein TolC